MRSLAQKAMLILALLVAVAPWAPVAATSSLRSHLFLTSGDRYEALYTALQASGSRVLQAFPGWGLIAETDPTIAAAQVTGGLADYVTADAIAADVLDRLAPEARELAALWEALRAPAPTDAVESLPPENDVRLAADQPELTGLALDPSLYQQSEYMIGRVAVNIVLVESTGAADVSSEDWSPERQQHVFQEVVRATSWWQARQPQAQVEFVYQDHYRQPVPVSYEPVSRPHSEDRLWISEAMQQLGFGHSSYLTATRLFNRATRQTHQADWAFTIYVVDSLNDGDNRFADGYFAYAYIHGPYLVVTYGSNGYGPENMAAVIAHEMGHIFGAMDEYAASGVTADRLSGYLGVPTYNAELDGHTDVGCIMRGGLQPFRLGQLCPCSAGQVGWRDSDGDGLMDPVDTAVQVQVAVNSDDAGVTVLGSATDVPYPSPIRAPITINHIAQGWYRVNEGPWYPLPCSDGSCDTAQELFELRLPPAPAGDWLIEVSFANSRGVSAAASQTLTVRDGNPPSTAASVEATVTAQDEGTAVINGQVEVQDSADPVAALDVRVDSGPWTAIAAGEPAGGILPFSHTLAGLTSGNHTVAVRAATANPWSPPAAWSGDFQVTLSQPQPGPSLSRAMYLPMIVSTS